MKILVDIKCCLYGSTMQNICIQTVLSFNIYFIGIINICISVNHLNIIHLQSSHVSNTQQGQQQILSQLIDLRSFLSQQGPGLPNLVLLYQVWYFRCGSVLLVPRSQNLVLSLHLIFLTLNMKFRNIHKLNITKVNISL